jgi:hypothetical protein
MVIVRRKLSGLGVDHVSEARLCGMVWEIELIVSRVREKVSEHRTWASQEQVSQIVKPRGQQPLGINHVSRTDSKL